MARRDSRPGTRVHRSRQPPGLRRGRHFCLGATLSKFEVQAAIAQLLDAMQDIRYRDGVAPPDVGLFLRGPIEMRLRFTPAA